MEKVNLHPSLKPDHKSSLNRSGNNLMEMLISSRANRNGEKAVFKNNNYSNSNIDAKGQRIIN